MAVSEAIVFFGCSRTSSSASWRRRTRGTVTAMLDALRGAAPGWVPEGDPLYVAYHDEEWGVPSRDERHLFEMLVLEGAQAGLSWSTILRKREGYREAFAGFDAEKVARFGADGRRAAHGRRGHRPQTG